MVTHSKAAFIDRKEAEPLADLFSIKDDLFAAMMFCDLAIPVQPTLVRSVTAMMQNFGSGIEDDFPAAANNAQAPFQIFAIHVKPLIESANLRDHFSFDKYGRAQQKINLTSSRMIPVLA